MSICEEHLDSFSRRLLVAAQAADRDSIRSRRRWQRWAALGSIALALFQPARGLLALCRRQPFASVCQDPGSGQQDGVRLQRSDAPDLFAMLQEMHDLHAAPRVDAVYLNEQLSAVAAQQQLRSSLVPRLTCLWRGQKNVRQSENRLIIGRALLRVLSVEDLRAVVAHELGHFAEGHGALAARFQFLHQAWSRLGDRLAADHGRLRTGKGASAAAYFARWYLCRLMVLVIPLYRRAEMDADQFASRIVGAKALAQALVRTAIAQAQADDRSGHSAEQNSRCQEDHITTDAEIFAQLLGEETALLDSHPSLHDRLAALGVAAKLPPPLQRNALSLLA